MIEFVFGLLAGLTDFSQVYEEADRDMYQQKKRHKTKKHISN